MLSDVGKLVTKVTKLCDWCQRVFDIIYLKLIQVEDKMFSPCNEFISDIYMRCVYIIPVPSGLVVSKSHACYLLGGAG